MVFIHRDSYNITAESRLDAGACGAEETYTFATTKYSAKTFQRDVSRTQPSTPFPKNVSTTRMSGIYLTLAMGERISEGILKSQR